MIYRWKSRKLWAVLLISPRYNPGSPMMIGEAWAGAKRDLYHGQPGACLLFTSRDAARFWCREHEKRYAHHGWRFKPVRVTESVTLCRKSTRRPKSVTTRSR